MKNVHLDGGARALPRPFFFFFLFFFVFFEHTEGVVRDRKDRGATLNVPSMPREREKEYPLKFIPAFPRTGRYLGRNKVSRHFERICLVAGILSGYFRLDYFTCWITPIPGIRSFVQLYAHCSVIFTS